MSDILHQPVLVSEVLSALVSDDRRAVYIDCTVGLGGHTEAILKATLGKVMGMDRDDAALALATKRLAPYADRVTLYRGSFRQLSEIAQNLDLASVKGILFDLGVSSLQLNVPHRGFSCKSPGPLDMRMDPSLPHTAADLVNTLPEREIMNLIKTYGEEKAARKIARAIIRHRERTGPITTTERLSQIVCSTQRGLRWTRLHPATKTFQALRIAVNDELGELEAGLSHALPLLAVGGRLAVISFHSLEDRIVKRYFKAAMASSEQDKRASTFQKSGGHGVPRDARTGRRFISLYKKPVTPTAEEMRRNPSARSAKLRVLERVA